MTSHHLKQASAVAAVVVWYEPTTSYVNNVVSYANCAGHTWVIDNSTMDHSAWLSDYPNVTYLWLGSNYGIAHALNEGCRLAGTAGYDYILTMDQDSHFDIDQLHQHFYNALEAMKDDKVAIVAAGIAQKLSNTPALCECESAITSGNLLRLKSWLSVKGFDAKLFIDQVDHDFCCRLRRQGYRILINNNVTMHHQIGNPLTGTFLGKHITSTNHSWVRCYYHMRNSLYLRYSYPEYSKPLMLFLRDVRDHCLSIILLEQEVCLKLKAMVLGAWDFFKGQYGAWDDIRPLKK